MEIAVTQPAKIKLKVGSIELEYEGDPAFLKEGLESLLVTMTDLAKVAPDIQPSSEGETETKNFVSSAGAQASGHQVATATIAAHMNAKTCPQLLVCALANLEIVQGKAGATRAEIAAQMQTATAYYKTTMKGGNLSTAFTNLTKAKKINDIGSGKYSLSAAEKKTLEATIAAI